MRHRITLSVAVLLNLAAHAQETRSSIHFASGSAALDASAIRTLDRMCGSVRDKTPVAIIISGHTDNVGSDDYNRSLSVQRANAVRAQLLTACPSLSAARIDCKGEADPLADNAEEQGRAQNRRVEITVIMPADKSTPESATDEAVPHCDQATLYMHPKVTRLLPAADKPREMHRADASKPVDFTASDGTRVRIAANALVDGSGKAVTGAVDISYRSFSEPYEIIASGIPMHVATPDGAGHMETAGMYELYASQNGSPVLLKQGERIALERPETGAVDSSYTGWQLDTGTGAWAAGGTITRPASIVLTSTQTVNPLTTKAVAKYWREIERLAGQERPDTTLFDVRRASGEYCRLTMCDTSAPGKAGWRAKRDRYEEGGVPRIQVIGHKGIYDPDHLAFTISIEQDRAFPEWRRLPHDAVWQYDGPHKRDVFKRLYGKRHVYQDIDLVMEPDGTKGILRLKENGEWLELPVDASMNRSTGANALRWDRALRNYEKALAKHRTGFDRTITHKHKRYVREHVNEHLMAWKQAKPDMNEEEAAIRSEGWRDYAVPRRPRPLVWRAMNKETEAALSNVRTTFGLDGFGIYNIDRIMKMAQQQSVIAATMDEEGKPFPWVAAYAVLNTERSVITYWGDGRGEADNMLVSPGKMKSLFLVDEAGNVATASTGPLNTGEPRAVLTVKRLDQSTDLETLRTVASK